MENWSYRIKEFWLLNKREIKRYGVCLWFLIVGIVKHVPVLALAGLAGAFVMWSYDRWLQPYAERGRLLMESRSKKPHT